MNDGSMSPTPGRDGHGLAPPVHGERVAKHPAFRHVAEVLGQDHTGFARGVPLRDLRPNRLRDAILTTTAEPEELRHGDASDSLGGHIGSDEQHPDVP